MVLPSWPTSTPSGVVEQLPAEAPVGAHQAEVGQRRPGAPASRATVAGASTPGAVGGDAVVRGACAAKASRSRGRIASIEPAGAFERARAQTGAGLRSGVGLELDVADRGAEQDRLVRAGRRVGQARAARTGARAGSRRTASRAAPRRGGRARSSRRCCRRTARRAGTAAARRGGRRGTSRRQSSPTPVSVKMSPSKPAVWLSSWRAVIDGRRGLVADLELRAGRCGIGSSRSTLPSSTSCITSVAVHTLVIDPIWKTESAVASTPVDRAQQAGGVVDDLAAGEDGHSRAGHVVLLDERGQLLRDPGLHVGQVAHAAHRKNEPRHCVRRLEQL